MVVKDNHSTLRKKLTVFFKGSSLFDAEIRSARSEQVVRGRVETRHLLCSDDLPAEYTGFSGVKQAFCIRRTVVHKRTGEIRQETVVGITSLSAEQAGPHRLLSLLQGHWHIENKSHWVRDVVFGEDHSQVRKGNIPQVLAALRNAVIGLLRSTGHSNITATCRRYAARPEEALELLGIGKTE